MTNVIQSAPWDDDEFEGREARSAEGGDQRGSSGGEAGGAHELCSHFGGRLEGEEREGASRIEADLDAIDAPRRRRTRRARTTRDPEPKRRAHFTPRQRLLILDTWLRSKLPAKDFAGLVGVSQHSLYKWKAAFEAEGPAGLSNAPKRSGGSRLSDSTKRAILMLKNAHPEWGQDRIHQTLLRSEGFAASPGAIGRYLASEGFVVEAARTKPHPDKVRRFERARVNELWQTDLFTFVMKREGRRVHMVAFMGRPQPLHRGLGPAREFVEGAGDGGVRVGGGELRCAEGSADGQRLAVPQLARQERVPQAARASRHPPNRGASASPADAGEGRTLLADPLARVRGAGRVPRHRRRAGAHRSLRRLLQLPAHEPGHRRAGAGGPLLRGVE